MFKSNDNATSWSESIKAYETSKKTLGWNPGDFVPVEKLSSGARALKQREVDPISMTFRDPIREQERLNLRTAALDAKKNAYLDAKSTQRNIILNTTSANQMKQYETLRNSLALTVSRDRNLISHLQNGPDHTNCPILYNEDYMNRKVQVRNVKKNNLVDPVKRDFDIMSNKYFENDYEKQMDDHEKARNYIIKKFSETRDLDPIKMRYYDEDKEVSFNRTSTAKIETIRANKLSNLPPSLKFSEGNSYNILNTEKVVDDTGLNNLKLKEQKRMNRIKKLATESSQRSQGDKLYATSEARRLERVKYDRFKYQMERGYNPLTLSTELPVPLYGGAPPTSWSRMHRSEDNLGFTGIGELSLPTRNNNSINYNINNRSSADNKEYLSSKNQEPQIVNSIQSHASNHNHNPYSSRNNNTATNTSRDRIKLNMPLLDLTHASQAEKVFYNDKTPGPSGLPVPMIRTGGGVQSFR